MFGRYAGFTALLPTMAGAADRCVIPEFSPDVEHLTELMTYDRNRNPSRYSVVLVSEGAREVRVDTAINISYAFGGQNACVERNSNDLARQYIRTRLQLDEFHLPVLVV